MILPLAVFVQLAGTCAPSVAPETLTAVARTESSLDPNAFLDNTTGRSYRPQDQAEAIRLAQPLLAAGHSIDVGLMGINTGNWGWLDLTLETAFDPCQNVRAGAAVLTAFSRYNTGHPTKGLRNGYVQRVVANMGGLGPAATRQTGNPGASSPPRQSPSTAAHPPTAPKSRPAFQPAQPDDWKGFPGERSGKPRASPPQTPSTAAQTPAAPQSWSAFQPAQPGGWIAFPGQRGE
jgi:type IV secretion system protein VirB1